MAISVAELHSNHCFYSKAAQRDTKYNFTSHKRSPFKKAELDARRVDNKGFIILAPLKWPFSFQKCVLNLRD